MVFKVCVSGADHYGLANVKIDEKPEFLTGDLDEDWDITVQDAQLALKAYTRQVADLPHGLTEKQFRAADVSGDGELSVNDAQFILKYYTSNSVAKKDTPWSEIIGETTPPAPVTKTEVSSQDENGTKTETKTEQGGTPAETKTDDKTDEKADAKTETK